MRGSWTLFLLVACCTAPQITLAAPPLQPVNTQKPRPVGGENSVELIYNPVRVHVRARVGQKIYDLGIHPEQVSFADWANRKANVVGAVFANIAPSRLAAAQKELSRASEAATRWGVPLYDLLGEDLRLRKVSGRELAALQKAPRSREIFREGIDGDERQLQSARMFTEVLPAIPEGFAAYHIDKDALSKRQGYMYPPQAWRAKGYVVAKEVREGGESFLEAPNGWRVAIKARTSAREMITPSQSCVSFAIDALAKHFPETGLGALGGEQRSMTYGMVDALFRGKSKVKPDAISVYYPGEQPADSQARLLEEIGQREKPPVPLAQQGQL